MNENIDFLELIYQYLKKEEKKCSFEDLWNAISKDLNNVDNQSKDELIGEIYTDLVLDNRFVLTSDGLWGLREFIKFEEIKKQYDYVDKFESTQEFEDLGDDEEEGTVEFNDDETKEFDDDYYEDDYGNGDDDDDDSLDDEYGSGSVAKNLGITEELDWKKIEREMEENN